jgi:hypothetical protein
MFFFISACGDSHMGLGCVIALCQGKDVFHSFLLCVWQKITS